MKTLAIDTSLAAGSVAAREPSPHGIRLAERPLGPAREHARLLAGALVEVAAVLGWGPDAAELVAVVRGPGSFTGLRVGVAAAKAICWATGARLIGVSAFEVVARRTAEQLHLGDAAIAIAFDAGRGDVYATLAKPAAASPTGWVIGAGQLLPATAWLDALAPGMCVSGPALELLADAATARGLAVAPRAAWMPTAAEAAAIAAARAAAGEADDPHTLVPEYSRPSYADEKPLQSSG